MSNPQGEKQSWGDVGCARGGWDIARGNAKVRFLLN